MISFLTFFSFGQGEKGKVFFDVSTSLVMPNFIPKPQNNKHFNPLMSNLGFVGMMKIGAGYRFPSKLTLGLKVALSYLDLVLDEYYADLEKTYPNSYIYTNEKSINRDSTFTFDYTFTAEIGYLFQLKKVNLKPNLEIGLLNGTLRKNTYGYRSNAENFITIVSFAPRILSSIYFQPSVDVGLQKWKRAFLHFGYGYTPMRIRLETAEKFPDGDVHFSSEINRFAYHRFIVGFKFVL